MEFYNTGSLRRRYNTKRLWRIFLYVDEASNIQILPIDTS